jgi:hypothetical protein
MSDQVFYKQFGITFGVAFLLVLISYFIKVLAPYIGLSIAGFVFFNLLTLVIYIFAKRSLKSSNKYLFNNLVILNVMVKMFVSVGIIISFQRISQPSDNWYVVPFLVLYLIYTIFETYMLTKLAKINS